MGTRRMCSEQVSKSKWSDGRPVYTLCSRWAVVHRGLTPYCRQHDPVTRDLYRRQAGKRKSDD